MLELRLEREIRRWRNGGMIVRSPLQDNSPQTSGFCVVYPRVVVWCLDGNVIGLLWFGGWADGSVEGNCGGRFDLEGRCEGGEGEGTEGYERAIKNERRAAILC